MRTNEEVFDFNLNQVNKIKPKNLKNIDGKIEDLNAIINDLANENFEENEYFDLKKNEQKLVKAYQILTQYLLFSIRHLNKKNALLGDLTDQQYKHNELADDVIKQQKSKIKQLEKTNNELDNNLISMEYLIKNLGLDKVIMKLGLQSNFHKENIPNDNVDPSRMREDLRSSSFFHADLTPNDDYTDNDISDDI